MMGATLTVNLQAIQANYVLLRQRHRAHQCAAVVKANAYGLGATAVSHALWQTGCTLFFVATLEEAVELRTHLPEAQIAVFQGPSQGEEKDYTEHRITPVINTLEQASRFARMTGGELRMTGILHIDTGMTRLGLTHFELSTLCHSSLVTRYPLIMSHLACANDPAHPKNAKQLARFKEALALMPGAKASLCNSAGLFLDEGFHFDLARPGCALYGINPHEGACPVQPVATLRAPILQLRTLDRDETIGYGATYRAAKGARIAITALGYADGMFRSLSNQGFAYICGERVPFAGRVSMDMIALDVSKLPEALLNQATEAEFINAKLTVNHLAETTGTIGYEIFTRIGPRVKRVYS